jgi:hypothetical protein
LENCVWLYIPVQPGLIGFKNCDPLQICRHNFEKMPSLTLMYTQTLWSISYRYQNVILIFLICYDIFKRFCTATSADSMSCAQYFIIYHSGMLDNTGSEDDNPTPHFRFFATWSGRRWRKVNGEQM